MRSFGRRRRSEARVRAEWLDAALNEWLQGRAVDVTAFGGEGTDPDSGQGDPLGDELAAALALRAHASGLEPVPHEALVTLRAALAAREAAAREPRWRRTITIGRLAPIAASAVVVLAVVLAAPGRESSPVVTTPGLAANQARKYIGDVRQRLLEVQHATEAIGSPDANRIQDAIVEAQKAAAAAQAAAELADGKERRRLLAQVAIQQRQIEALRNQVAQLSARVVDAPTTTSTTTSTSTTTTTTPPTTTTTSPIGTSTTVRPQAPTTTSTTRPPSSSTTAPSSTTTTTTPPPPDGDFGTGNF